jgi:hypothetical protein
MQNFPSTSRKKTVAAKGPLNGSDAGLRHAQHGDRTLPCNPMGS